jgi:hypothetical protein
MSNNDNCRGDCGRPELCDCGADYEVAYRPTGIDLGPADNSPGFIVWVLACTFVSGAGIVAGVVHFFT